MFETTFVPFDKLLIWIFSVCYWKLATMYARLLISKATNQVFKRWYVMSHFLNLKPNINTLTDSGSEHHFQVSWTDVTCSLYVLLALTSQVDVVVHHSTATKMCFLMSELTDGTSLARNPLRPSQPPVAETKANLTQRLEMGQGRGVHVGSEGHWWWKYLVSSFLACLIGHYWKMSFVLGPRPARWTEETLLTDAQSTAGICRCG